MTDILDIENILYSSGDRILFLLAAAVFFIALAFLFYLFWKKRKKTKPLIELTPLDEALYALNHLDPMDPKVYFYLSEILRHYLKDQFKLPAVEKTTPEIKSELDIRTEIAHESKKEIIDFLERADWIKFTNPQGGKNNFINDRHHAEQLIKALDASVKSLPSTLR